MKRIHIISPFLSRFGGGVFTVIKALYSSRSLLTQKNSLFFIWGYKDDFCKIDCKSLKGEKFFFNYKFKFLNKIFYSGKFKKKLFNNIEEGDIIHLHTLWLYPSIMFRNYKNKRIKKIISPHGMLDKWALNNNKFKKNVFLNFFEKRNLNTADCLHALCEQEYKDIKILAPNVPIAIVPNGIYLPNLKIDKKLNNNKRLLFLGRIHPKKGLTNLLNAWCEFENEENWELIIAGVDENGYEKSLKKIVFDNKLYESVKFVGPVFGKKKEELLLSSSAFILPSFSEGLPMSVLEAWSYKLPVLMTRECNLEIGINKKASILIDTTISGIKNGLLAISNLDNDELIKMGENAYNLVETDFTWDIVSEKMEKVYLWLTNKIEKPDFIK